MKTVFMHKNEDKVWEQLKEKMINEYESDKREISQLKEKINSALKAAGKNYTSSHKKPKK